MEDVVELSHDSFCSEGEEKVVVGSRKRKGRVKGRKRIRISIKLGHSPTRGSGSKQKNFYTRFFFGLVNKKSLFLEI